MNIILSRTAHSITSTLGTLEIFENDKSIFACKTLELPWLNNAPRKSCIPNGTYYVHRNNIPKFGKHLYFTSVPNRSGILVHAGNYTSQILGCILVGTSFADLNHDNTPDIINSRITIDKIYNLLPNENISFKIQ